MPTNSFVDGIRAQKYFLICSLGIHFLLFTFILGGVSKSDENEPTKKSQIINAIFFTPEQVVAMQKKKSVPELVPKTVKELISPIKKIDIKNALNNKVAESIEFQVLRREVENAGFLNEMAALDYIIQKQTEKSYDGEVFAKEFEIDSWEVGESTLSADMFEVPNREVSPPHKKEFEQRFVMDPLIIYQRKIALKLQGAMRLDESMDGEECLIEINLSRDGIVVSSSIRQGDTSLCDEASKATIRAGKLPMPVDSALYTHLNSLQIRIIPQIIAKKI